MFMMMMISFSDSLNLLIRFIIYYKFYNMFNIIIYLFFLCFNLIYLFLEGLLCDNFCLCAIDFLYFPLPLNYSHSLLYGLQLGQYTDQVIR